MTIQRKRKTSMPCLPAKAVPRRGRVARCLNAFGVDSRGSVAITAALLMPVLVLGMGLGAETGYQYMTQRKLQNAADLAAHAGGVRLRAGGVRLRASGVRLRAGGVRLRAGGVRLRAGDTKAAIDAAACTSRQPQALQRWMEVSPSTPRPPASRMQATPTALRLC